MSVAPAPREAPGPGRDRALGLIERADELTAIDDAVARLSDRLEGGVVVIEAAAGLGKSALVESAAPLAADGGCGFRGAAPSTLERPSPYGVTRALLEAPVRDASPEESARLLEGVAGRAGELLLDGNVP